MIFRLVGEYSDFGGGNGRRKTPQKVLYYIYLLAGFLLLALYGEKNKCPKDRKKKVRTDDSIIIMDVDLYDLLI